MFKNNFVRLAFASSAVLMFGAGCQLSLPAQVKPAVIREPQQEVARDPDGYWSIPIPRNYSLIKPPQKTRASSTEFLLGNLEHNGGIDVTAIIFPKLRSESLASLYHRELQCVECHPHWEKIAETSTFVFDNPEISISGSRHYVSERLGFILDFEVSDLVDAPTSTARSLMEGFRLER